MFSYKREAGSLEQLHATYATPSNFLVGILPNVRRHDCRDKTNTKSTNNSPDIELCQTRRVQSRTGLKYTANDEDDIRDDEGLLSAKCIGHVERRHGPKEATRLKNGNDVAREIGVLVRVFIQAKTVLETRHREDTANETYCPLISRLYSKLLREYFNTGIPSKQHPTKRRHSREDISSAVLDYVLPYRRLRRHISW